MARGPEAGGWTPERSVAGKRNPWSIVAVISIATFMTVLDTSIANVALNHIAGGMSVSYDEATWITTSFLIATAVVIPISGWLATVIGRKRYYMMSVVLFSGASFLCGIAPNLTFLILARIVQGAAGGGLMPVEQSMLADTFPPEKRSLAFAAYGVVAVTGPIFGPVIGGWITDNFTWHWCFLINVPVGALSLTLVHLFVEEPDILKREREEHLRRGLKADILGFLLVGGFLGFLEVTLDRGQREDWFSSPMILTTAVLSALCLICAIPWELTREEPIVPIRMFGQRNFAIASILLLITGMIIFSSTQFIPQLLQQVVGYTATDAGLAMTAGGLAILAMLPVAGVLSNKIDPRWLIGFAFLVQGLAMAYMGRLDTQLSFGSAALARLYQSFAIPLLFVPVTNMAYVGLKPEQSNDASALLNVARTLGGTFGISGVQTLLAQRQQYHQAHMVEGLNPLNPNYAAAIARAAETLSAHGVQKAQASQMAAAMLYRQVVPQTQMLSYLDLFHVLMLMSFACIPLLLVMRAKPPGEASGGGL